ncbi:MAG: hypothetical protein COB98_05770 [Flavobacteriaceae bacterium]|nr:MAG: hypothetical protein COB98_05770 [Flavobacteriaceae bacterium]
MNKHIYKILPVLFVLFMTSCEQEDDTEGVSRITYYNDIELIGDNVIVIKQGTPYSEQGVIAFEGEEDVTANVETSGSVDHTTTGFYEIQYDIVNKDGFAKNISRSVFVVPAVVSDLDVTGTYTGDVNTGVHKDVTNISKIANGLFLSDDFFGGRYNIGKGYGKSYRLKTYFYINPDNTTYTALWSDSPWGPWGIVNTNITGTTLSHKVEASPGGFGFNVTLIKQ